MLYEGGIRVPAMARFPGVIPPGSLCGVPAGTTDLPPTFLELAGVTVPEGPDRPDGISLVPVLLDPSASLPREALFPSCLASAALPPLTPASAVRKGDWKLVEFYEDGTRELYDLARIRASPRTSPGSILTKPRNWPVTSRNGARRSVRGCRCRIRPTIRRGRGSWRKVENGRANDSQPIPSA